MGFEHDDPTLRTGEGGLTVWKLQEMVQAGQLDELDALFRNGLTMNRLPSGYAAGAAARVLDVDTKAFGEVLDCLTGKNWRGKIFFTSADPTFSKRGGPRNSDSLLRWDPDPGEGVWHATEETELSG